MNTKPNRGDEPAMPGFSYTDGYGNQKRVVGQDGEVTWETYLPGLTVREHFAGLAMQGICAADKENRYSAKDIACWTVETVDALIAELTKEKDGGMNTQKPILPAITSILPDPKDWNKYYGWNTYCSNCLNSEVVWILKETPRKGLSFNCEKCGCLVNL